jgi:hypothetical protein
VCVFVLQCLWVVLSYTQYLGCFAACPVPPHLLVVMVCFEDFISIHFGWQHVSIGLPICIFKVRLVQFKSVGERTARFAKQTGLVI